MKKAEQSETKPTFLNQVVVRPILPEEKALWVELMAQEHYLGCKGLIGETIRYVATSADNKWLALLGWGSAALHCGVRDKWIGWSEQIKRKRLILITNNIRFLILPGMQIKNLASKILSLNLKRLSDDWQYYHGHPIVLAETFVDPRRFMGTCYKAANWLELGKTSGFGKSAKKYIYHGDPKMYLCRQLVKQTRSLLVNPSLPEAWSTKMIRIPFTKKQLDALRDCLRGLPEHRGRQGLKHNMHSIIAIAVCALLCGARSYDAISDWGQECSQSTLKRLGAYYDWKKKIFIAPSERTTRRVLQECDATTIDGALTSWLATIAGRPKKGHKKNSSPIAVDGKVVRGAKNNEGKQVNLLSAFLHDQGIVVAQREIDDKTNEIPEIKPLLNSLGNIAGRVITADALHTQKETARFIVEDKKANYVFTVKDNQPTLNSDIKALDLERFPPRCRNNREGARENRNKENMD